MMKERWTVIIAVCVVIIVILLVLNIDRLSDQPDIDSIISDLKVDTNISYTGGTNPGAKVEIIAFLDYDCPHCQSEYLQLKQLLSDYGSDINIIFKQFPLHGDEKAIAAECARQQGSFWEYSDVLFLKDNFDPIDIASSLDLEIVAFNDCITSQDTADIVKKDKDEGLLNGVEGTPTIFIDGYKFEGSRPYSTLAEFVENEIS